MHFECKSVEDLQNFIWIVSWDPDLIYSYFIAYILLLKVQGFNLVQGKNSKIILLFLYLYICD